MDAIDREYSIISRKQDVNQRCHARLFKYTILHNRGENVDKTQINGNAPQNIIPAISVFPGLDKPPELCYLIFVA